MTSTRTLAFIFGIVAFLILLIFLANVFFVPPTPQKEVRPKTLIVPDTFETIESAVTYAAEGDTVFIRTGKYNEILRISKNLTLIGEDRELTVINGEGAPAVISVFTSGVTLTGFTVTTGEESPRFVSQSALSQVPHAIELVNVSYCNITSNNISNNSCAILASDSQFNCISGNTLESNGYGIVLTDSSNDNQVADNSLSKNNIGIALYGCRSNTFSGNEINGNRRSGLLLRNSELNKITRNSIVNNSYGVLFSDSSNNVIHHNNFIDNKNQTEDEGLNPSDMPSSVPFSVNSWTDGREGNYWSDFNGTLSYGYEFNPYVIDENNQDSYPLIEPSSRLVPKNLETTPPSPKIEVRKLNCLTSFET